MADRCVIDVDGVSFRYPERRTDALADATFAVSVDEWVGLLGPNGGGKTTLLRLLLGQLTPRCGRIEVLGQPPARARRRVGYVPQHAKIDPGVPATVRDIVLLGRLGGGSWGPSFSRSDHSAAAAALEEANCADLADLPWRSLSGGQQQRVLVARALAAEVDLLLLDEPTTGIDFHRERELLRLLERLNQRLPIVMVSHDIALVSHHMDRAFWVDREVHELDTANLDSNALEQFFHGEHR